MLRPGEHDEEHTLLLGQSRSGARASIRQVALLQTRNEHPIELLALSRVRVQQMNARLDRCIVLADSELLQSGPNSCRTDRLELSKCVLHLLEGVDVARLDR